MPDFRPLARLSLFLSVLVLASTPAGADPVKDAEGLWEYTGLVTRDGESLPLTGVFLISQGTFVQQSIFNEEPFATAGSMAHAGPYWSGGAGLRLTSQQTLSLDPKSDKPLSSAGALEHDLKVERQDTDLTLTFGGGTSTVQTFTQLGSGADTQLFRFVDGVLALSDGYFILVAGTEDRVVSGYGTYVLQGNDLSMAVVRWAESDGESVTNHRDLSLGATLDDTALVLDDGRRFPLVD